MGFTVHPVHGPGEKYDPGRFEPNPFSGTKYVDAEWFIDLCWDNKAYSYDDADGWGGGGFYVRIDPAKADVMRAAILAHHVNVEAFGEWLDWLLAHPDAYIEGYH